MVQTTFEGILEGQGVAGAILIFGAEASVAAVILDGISNFVVFIISMLYILIPQVKAYFQ